MSTEEREPSSDHPTTPIPRASGRGDDEPTQVVQTSASRGQQSPEVTPTAPLPTGARGTRPLSPEAPRTEPLAGGMPGGDPHRTSAFPAPGGTGGPTAAADGADHRLEGASTPAPAPIAPPAPAVAGATTTPVSASAGPVGATSSPTSGATASAGREPASSPGAAVAGAAPPEASRTLRVGTVVWGLIIAIIGAGFIAVAAGARFDLELVLIGLLALAGVALVAGSMAVSLRRRH